MSESFWRIRAWLSSFLLVSDEWLHSWLLSLLETSPAVPGGQWGVRLRKATAYPGPEGVQVCIASLSFQLRPLYSYHHLRFPNNYFVHILVMAKSYMSLFLSLIFLYCFRIKLFYLLSRYLIIIANCANKHFICLRMIESSALPYEVCVSPIL